MYEVGALLESEKGCEGGNMVKDVLSIKKLCVMWAEIISFTLDSVAVMYEQ